MTQFINKKMLHKYCTAIYYIGYTVEHINNTVILCKFATDIFVKDKKCLVCICKE